MRVKQCWNWGPRPKEAVRLRRIDAPGIAVLPSAFPGYPLATPGGDLVSSVITKMLQSDSTDDLNLLLLRPLQLSAFDSYREKLEERGNDKVERSTWKEALLLPAMSRSGSVTSTSQISLSTWPKSLLDTAHGHSRGRNSSALRTSKMLLFIPDLQGLLKTWVL